MQNDEAKSNVESKEDKVYSYIKEKKLSLFLVAFVLIVAVRLYFLFMTQNQPLWWDESEYMSGAKAYAGLVDYTLSGIRSPGFSLLGSIFFKLGMSSDLILRFFLAFIPSIIVLLLTYTVTKEMYEDKSIAIISMLIMAFIWEHIFYSNRFHTENLSLVFQYLAIFVLYKSYIKKEKSWIISPKYSLIFVAIFSIIAISFRPGNVIFVPALILFVPLMSYKKIMEHRNKMYAGLIALFVFGIAVLLNLSKIPIVSSYYKPNDPISFNTLTSFFGFYRPSLLVEGLFFYFFLFGVIYALINLWIRYPLIKDFSRDKNLLDFKSDIFNFLLIISVLGCMIFLMKVNQFEYRWLFPLALGMVGFTSKGIVKVSEYVQKMSKEASTIFVILILVLGLYGQFSYSKSLVESKVTSYEQVKEAGLWIKQNSNKEDSVVSASVPQNTYYSERKTYYFDKNESLFDEFVKETKPKYIVLSGFEPVFTPEWAYAWPAKNNLSVAQVYYTDSTKKQPILVIYNYD